MCDSLTRQQWLETATEYLAAHLIECGAESVPENIRVSVGFPQGSRKAIGQYFYVQSSSDKHHEIFVSPVIDNTVDFLGVLCHELIHAACGAEAGHGPAFRKLALAAGLTGKMTATVPGEDFKLWADNFISDHGDYPAGHIRDGGGTRKKQSTRLLKAECQDCGYTVRVTRKWADQMGAPLCPCNTEPMEMQ